MAHDFEWVDFALQPPYAMAESLDAAGIDGELPRRDAADAGAGPGPS